MPRCLPSGSMLIVEVDGVQIVQNPLEISIDLTAQELLEPPALDSMVEVDDVCDVDPLLRTGAFAANADVQPAAPDDSIEIELDAEEIEALLEATQST